MTTFDSRGARIAFDDFGPGNATKTIVLIHGFASNRFENWRRLGWYGAFERKRHRVLALDCRGHGESEKLVDPAAYSRENLIADVVGLLDLAGVPTADVMGYSMGARVALAVAREHPRRINHLVLGGIGDRIFDPPNAGGAMAQAMECVDADSISDPLLRSFRQFADEQGEDRRSLAAFSRASPQFASDTRMGVRELHLPALVVAGTRDTLAGDPEVLADVLPNGRAVSLPGCDHFSAIPHALFKAAVFDFLDDELA